MVYRTKEGSNGVKTTKDVVKDLLYFKDNKLDELSSSSNSVRSVESDLDYRQKRERSFKMINKLRRKTNADTDPYLSEKLGKFY